MKYVAIGRYSVYIVPSFYSNLRLTGPAYVNIQAKNSL